MRAFGGDPDDYRSWAYLRLLQNDGAILRRYRGGGPIAAYLRTVAKNLLRDYRIAQLGKWRPSSHAVSTGPYAVELDRRINRDGESTRQAVAAVAKLSGRCPSEVADVAAVLPRRPRRTFVGADHLECLPSADHADRALRHSEHQAAQDAVTAALEATISELALEDQRLLRLRYWGGFTVAEIARRLEVPQKPLYPRLQRCLSRLAEALSELGVNADVVRDVLTESAGVC